MSADLIKLRQVRKARARADKQVKAAENRAKFGRTKAEREIHTAADQLERRRHAAHERDITVDHALSPPTTNPAKD